MFDPGYIIEVDDEDLSSYSIIYDIEYINPEWSYLTQRLDLRTLENGYYYYNSSFELIDKNNNQNFTHYPRECKAKLWQAIFGLKEYVFGTFSPDIVEHLVDTTYASFGERVELYTQYFNPEGYMYITDRTTSAFQLVKKAVYVDLKWGELKYYEY